MKSLTRILLLCLFYTQFIFNCLAQTGIITTYVGPGLPVMGALAITQPVDNPCAVTPDGVGGFYVASSSQNRVYRVAADGKLTLVAGSGVYGFSGDGGQAASAQLASPLGLLADSAGNLYIADTHNHRIRKVTPAGAITTVAGNGTSGFSGDGGLAASAQLSFPDGVTMDSAGNLYIADFNNLRIRKVTPAGVITTVAGNGSPGFSGDGGLATSAQITRSWGLTSDSTGNIYIADTYSDRIRKVTPAGIITTVAGTGASGFSGDGGLAVSAQLNRPFGVALDSANNLYIADINNNRIRKVTPAGIITTVAGSGTAGFSGDGSLATSASLFNPHSVTVDSAGNLYIADQGNNCIRKVTPAGVITTAAGNGTAGFSGDGSQAASAQLDNPRKVAVDSAGNLYIADASNNRIRKVTPAGVITTAAGNGTAGFSGDGGLATSAQLNLPTGVAMDSAGNLYIADNLSNRIRKVTSVGVITTVAGNGNGGFSGDGGLATSAQLRAPTGVEMDSAGNLYIADALNNRVRKVTPAGIITTIAGNGTSGFSGDGGLATSAQLNNPAGIVMDSAGNLYIADNLNNRIRKITPAGVITTVAGNGASGFSGDGGLAASAQLSAVSAVTMDSAGNLYIADSSNNRIRKITPAGVITTVAGNGAFGFSGDGGLATSAQIADPRGVAVDSAGNLYIADNLNNRIRKVTNMSSSDIFFPQVAVGGGWSTSFTLSNTSATMLSGNLTLIDTEGNPFTVNSSSLGVGSSFPISIPAGGAMFLTVNSLSPNDAPKNGWAMVETWGGSLNGVATFKSISQGVIQTAAGVLSSQPMQFATIPVDDNADQDRSTAYGIANPTDHILTIKLALVDSNGIVVDDTKSITLNPGQQIARYFNQDFLNRPLFQGSIVLRAQGGGTFVAVALIQNQQLFTAIPVIPGKSPNIPN
jgi:trimeric autotransporter adhesin